MSCRIRFFALLLFLMSLLQGCAAPSRWGEPDVRDAIGVADFGPAQGGGGGAGGVTLDSVLNAGNATLGSKIQVSGGDEIFGVRELTLRAGDSWADGYDASLIGGYGTTGSVGGNAVVEGGKGGGSGSAGNANGGNAVVRGGALAGTGANGTVELGTTQTSAVNVGAAGVTTTFTGTSNATILDGTVTALDIKASGAGSAIRSSTGNTVFTFGATQPTLYQGVDSVLTLTAGGELRTGSTNQFAFAPGTAVGTAADTWIGRDSAGAVRIGSTSGGADGTLALSEATAGAKTSDAAADNLTVTAGDAYAQAATNTTGADLILAGGLGAKTTTVADYTQALYTVTVTVNGTDTVLTEGTDWTNATSNDVSAGLLATAIDGVSGVSATAVAAVVYVTPDSGTYSLSLAETGTGNTVSNGADGSVLLNDGTYSAPAISFASDTDTGIRLDSGNGLSFVYGGFDKIQISGSGIVFKSTAVIQNSLSIQLGAVPSLASFLSNSSATSGLADLGSSNGGTDGTLRLGGIRPGIASKTASYTATASDHMILCDATSAAFTVTLPEAASNGGLVLVVKKTDASANAITIDGNGAETIDGAATQSLSAQYESVTIQCDGTEWWIQ